MLPAVPVQELQAALLFLKKTPGRLFKKRKIVYDYKSDYKL
jgi:hypothetical protein